MDDILIQNMIHMYDDSLTVSAKRSNCQRSHIGCLLYDKKNSYLSSGWNGDPQIGCERPTEQGNCGCVHAEISALARCHGYPSVAVTTIAPCLPCAKALYTAGVRTFLFFQFSRPGAWGLAQPWLEHDFKVEWAEISLLNGIVSKRGTCNTAGAG